MFFCEISSEVRGSFHKGQLRPAAKAFWILFFHQSSLANFQFFALSSIGPAG
jgi:hypothetical protein